MPKLPPSEKELMDRQVRASESFFREIKNRTIPKIAKCLGVCTATYKNWLNRPETMSLKSFREFVKFHNFPDEQILRMVRVEK